MSKILITGGAGFIGSSLALSLLAKGHTLAVVDNLFSGKRDYVPKEAKFYELDILSQDLSQVFSDFKPDYVFHLAAQIDVRKSVADPGFDSDVNIKGGLRVLEQCQKNQVKKIIFSSTGGAIYGEAEIIPTPETYEAKPLSPYGINKLAFEHYLRYYKEVFSQDYTVLRFANVYGPRQYKGGEAGVIAIFCQQAVLNQPLTLNGSGEQTRDFVYINDVVKALEASLSHDYSGELNIGFGKESALLEVIKALELASGKTLEIIKNPAPKGEQQRSCLDNSLAKKVLNWRPEVDLLKGIELTYNWSQDNLNKL
ncbi:MAG: NAD-dependent epimerase/dehydratase family protein [Candidatus Pacebacteria bacterium]|nr:NAD-dependent epimerase/dehydratase family protein [Candidatus Paceibacterota bacterium]